MKILIVSFYYSPELGAAPSRITNMAEGLKSQGAEVDVLTCLPNYPQGQIFEGYRGRLSKKEKINGINVYRYWTYATVSKNPFKRAVSMMSFATMLWLFAFKIKKIQGYDRVISTTSGWFGHHAFQKNIRAQDSCEHIRFMATFCC